MIGLEKRMTEKDATLDFSATETIIEDANGEILQEKPAKRPVGRPKKHKNIVPVQIAEDPVDDEVKLDEGDFANHYMDAIYCQGIVHGMLICGISLVTGVVIYKMIAQ